MVFAYLPTFITEVLGASKTKLGIIEGVAMFMAFASKVFSGVLSDYFKNRKPLIIIGSIFSLMIKPMFALAGTVNMVFAARFIDRLSKGIRSAPTDAIIADLAPKAHQGKSYGTRQALYTYGGMFGAFLASRLLDVTDHNYRLIFMLSMIPSVLAIIIAVFVIKQPPILEHGKKLDWHLKDIRFLPPRYWALLGVVAILMLARFSEGFVTLRAREAGWSLVNLPVVIVLMDLVHASTAYPMGFIADKFNRYKLMMFGLALTVAAHTTMIVDTWYSVSMGIVFIGVYLGIMQGLMSTLIAEATPAHLRGTAFALYYLVAGTSVLIGNVIAGHLSDTFGLNGAFWGGGCFTLLAMVALFFMMRRYKNYNITHEHKKQG